MIEALGALLDCLMMSWEGRRDSLWLRGIPIGLLPRLSSQGEIVADRGFEGAGCKSCAVPFVHWESLQGLGDVVLIDLSSFGYVLPFHHLGNHTAAGDDGAASIGPEGGVDNGFLPNVEPNLDSVSAGPHHVPKAICARKASDIPGVDGVVNQGGRVLDAGVLWADGVVVVS